MTNSLTLRHMTWWLSGLAVLFVLVWQAPAFYTVQGLANYLPLHIIAETFSIVVSMLVFGVAWNAHRLERSSNLAIVACTLLAVGLIDFAHMLSFAGMPDFITPSGAEKAINLWLSGRLLAALALLIVAWRPWRPFSNAQARYGMLAGSLAVAALVIWAGLVYPEDWPHTFIAGQGLTPFKIGAEYAIIAILLLPAVLFYRQARRQQSDDVIGLFGATVVTILSELCFTLYSDVADVFNLLGHLYKIVAYAFIYRAVFVASVRDPFQRLDAEYAENQRISRELQAASIYTRSLLEASLDPLVTISPRGKITDVNQATEKVTGKRSSELIGTDFSDYFTEPDKAREVYQQVFLKGSVTNYPLALRHRDGHVTDVLYNASVYRKGSGEVLGVFAAAHDITEQKRAEATRTQLAAIVESTNDAIIGKTSDGIITSWNKGAEKIYGYNADEIIGKHITILASPSRHAEIQKFLGKIRNGETVANYESERIRKDGTLIHVALTLSPIRDASGHIIGISTFARDITEKKRMEEELRQAGVYNRSLIEASVDPLVTISAEGKITDVNRATEAVTGWSRSELIGTDFSDYFTEPDKAREGYQQVFLKGSVTDYPLALRHRDGYVTDVLYNASVYRNEAGEVLGVFAAARDITERKLAEEQLRRSEHGLAEAQRIAHLGNWELNLENNVLTWSDEIYRMFEIDPEKFGASYDAFLNAIHPEDREMVNNAYTESLKNKVPYDIVHRLQMQDGRIKYVNEKCETYFGEDGKPLRSVGTVHDITERKLDEEALQRLNRELRAISNCNETLMRAEDEQALLDEICRIICEDAGYRMAWVGYPENDEAKTIRPVSWAGVESGYLEQAKLTWADTERGHGPSGAAIRSGESVSIQDFITDPNAAPWRDAAMQRGYRSSISLPIKDESAKTFGILNIYAAMPNAFTPEEIRLLEELAGDMAFGIMVLRARIERQRAEESLRQLNERFSLATRAGRLGVWDWDLQKNELVWDDRMYGLYGVKREDFAAAYEAWLKGLHPDDRARSDEISLQAQRGEREYDTEFRVVWPDGSIHHLKAYGQFVRDADGKPVRMTGVNFDITELKEAEAKVTELNHYLEARVAERTAQLEAANKDLEAFAYSVSHDLRTPLRAINGFSRILMDDYKDKLDDEGKRLLNVVRDNASRMDQLIDDILKFSRTGRMELALSEIDMESMAHAVFEELQPAVDSSKLQLEIEHIPPARGDSAMMRQVFVNLLSNAIKFSHNKELAKIKVGCSIEGDEAVYYVKDNGAGFDMQFADRLFGVFQRLHGVTEFEGTGIGLAIVKRIVTRHGGRVWAEGKPNEGATVYFALPAR